MDQMMRNMAPKFCADAVSSSEVQKLYYIKFDLIMINSFFCDCFMDIAEQLQVNLFYLFDLKKH